MSYKNKTTVAYFPPIPASNLPNIDKVVWSKLTDVSASHIKNIDCVMVDLPADLSDEQARFLRQCRRQKIPVYNSKQLLESLSKRVSIKHSDAHDLQALSAPKNYQYIKRLLDIALILMGLPLIFPIMLITIVLIRLESRGNVFFTQQRVGQGGQVFAMIKFRSMYKTAENTTQFAEVDDARVTRIGKMIRKTRIDELPQIFNVLKGEMSLIGPRPEQKTFVDQFRKSIAFYDYRHRVKPGISGWAQVMHGYAADTENTKVKLEYDLYYIKHCSFSMDLLILLKTVQTILTGFGSR